MQSFLRLRIEAVNSGFFGWPLQLLDLHLSYDARILRRDCARKLGKKIIGLNIFQASVFLLYISVGKVLGGTAPILIEGNGINPVIYSNPLPHVLILTAIVVGVATTALGLSLVVRINESYGTIEEDEITEMDQEP